MEASRDKWSIYLKSSDRANVYIQFDLWNGQVKYNGKTIYKIIDAK